jgi:hypothetical protein
MQAACRLPGSGQGDDMLCWFEAYADALDKGYYQV